MVPIKFCKLCNQEKYHDPIHQKYVCHPCRAEYAKKWRNKNPEKVKTNNINQRKKRIQYIKDNNLISPDRYKPVKEVIRFCEKHNQQHELATDGQWICRKCKRLYAINYRSNAKHKLYRRLAKFNLTEEQYNNLHRKTDGKCYICNKYETKTINGILIDISIDHCHETDKVRGILCHACNTSLGGFKDSIELLQSAITYLNSHQHQDE